MIRFAVFKECDESIVNALCTVGEISRVTAAELVDPSAHDLLIVDWRHRDLSQPESRPMACCRVPYIAVIDEKQGVPGIIDDTGLVDLVGIEEIGSAAFGWRVKKTLQRTRLPLSLDVLASPEAQLLQQLVDNLTDWAIVKDLEHRFLLVGEDFARTVGLSKEDIIGKNDLEIGTPKEAVLGNPETGWAGFWAQDDEVIKSGCVSVEENLDWHAFTVRHRYKRTIRVPLRNSTGCTYALLVIATDITDRARAERNLQARNRMLRRVTEEKLNADRHRLVAEQAIRAKNKFFAAASHDLRQPLHALGLFLSVLDNRLDDPGNLDILHKMRHSCDSLSALFNSLLDISRLDAGVIDVSLQNFSISDLLISVRDEFTQLAQARCLDVSVEVSDSIVHTDPVLLGRILRNLLQNAINHTRVGSIDVRCRQLGNVLHIDVADTGPGIPEQQFEAIFSEFYQLDNQQNTPTRGLGLGLAIVRKMAQLLDIEIQLRSVLGQGSTFSVAVPLGELDKVEEHDAHAPRHSIAGRNILLLDDEPDIREGLSLILDSFGCHTVSAESADEALRLLQTDQIEPDFIIADYRLKDGNTGTAAVERFRHHFRRNIPAVIVTGDTSRLRQQEARQFGCRLLHKPIDADELVEAVAGALDEELLVE
ncbi:MAG: response regulator [Granulosicoccus sp.]|nr:response regulator [Granulosicoccus sp.]